MIVQKLMTKPMEAEAVLVMPDVDTSWAGLQEWVHDKGELVRRDFDKNLFKTFVEVSTDAETIRAYSGQYLVYAMGVGFRAVPQDELNNRYTARGS